MSVAEFKNGLSFADPWTESDTIRAAEGYVDNGFLHNAGLPDITYGHQFSESGTEALLNNKTDDNLAWDKKVNPMRVGEFVVSSNSFVYTHYPPGPHVLAGISTLVFGKEKIAMFRIIPISIGLIAFAFFSFAFLQHFGVAVGFLSILIFANLPMISFMMHGLSYQGYSLALLFIEIGLLINIIGCSCLNRRTYCLFFLIGLVQGFLGFDYIFLVAMTPLLIKLIKPGNYFRCDALIRAAFALSIGFIFAHGLHFLQVIVYFDSFVLALSDFTAAASYRSNGESYDTGENLPRRDSILFGYLTNNTGWAANIGIPIWDYTLFAIALILLAKRHEHFSKKRAIVGIFFALIISSMWIIVMPQHAAQHTHFIPRHYFLSFFFTTLMLICFLHSSISRRGLYRL